MGRATKAVVIVPAKCIFFLRIKPEPPNSKCSVPREYHSHSLRKQRIPARLYAVLDAIGTTNRGYKPGTRWCHKCCTTVDKETRFTSHPDNKPPLSRTTEQ